MVPGVTVCTSCVGVGEDCPGVLEAIGAVGEIVGVREMASVSLAWTVWYAWVTLSVGEAVAREGILHETRRIAPKAIASSIAFLVYRLSFIMRKRGTPLKADQDGLFSRQLIVSTRKQTFHSPGQCTPG